MKDWLHELDKDEILDWFNNYCSDEDLEDLAKAIYSIYVQRRKQEYPEKHRANRQAKRNWNAKKKLAKKRYPKGYRKYEPALKQNKVVPYAEIRK